MRTLYQRICRKLRLQQYDGKLEIFKPEWLKDYTLAPDHTQLCWIWTGSNTGGGSRKRNVTTGGRGVYAMNVTDRARPIMAYHGKRLYMHRVLVQQPDDTTTAEIHYNKPLGINESLKRIQSVCTNNMCCNPYHFHSWGRRDLKGHKTERANFLNRTLDDPIEDIVDDLEQLAHKPGAENMTLNQLHEWIGHEYTLNQLREAIKRGVFTVWKDL